MTKILCNPEGFLREWREAARSLAPRDAGILEDVALRGRKLADVGKEHNLTRERVRQIVNQSIGQLRDAGRRNPQGELGRAAQATEELAEAAAIEVRRVRRMSRRGRDEMAGMLVRLDVIAADQARLAPAICFLAEGSREPRVSLGGMARDARDILLVHPSGLRPESLRRRLRAWREPMRAWPRLDVRTFVAARMDVAMTPGGRMRLAPVPGEAAMPRRTMAQRLELALRRAGRCLHYEELTERIRQASVEEAGHAPRRQPIQAHAARGVLSRDPRFRWAGRGTYGLVEWEVGLSVPHQASGGRPSVSMEIEHLLRDRDSIPLSELMEHVKRRLRVKASTVRVRAREMPGTEILDKTLYRVGSSEHRRARDRRCALNRRTASLTIDDVKRGKRQVDGLREVAAWPTSS